MKFIADAMLGKLAKRLRLLGYDVLYNPAYDDNEIIRLSLEQDRIILTRDTGLAERPLAANHLFIQSDHVKDQLKQVFEAFQITEEPAPLTRCSLCNEPLIALDKQEARDLVPQYVYDRNDSFLRCGKCGRVYWKGTHVKRMISLPQK